MRVSNLYGNQKVSYKEQTQKFKNAKLWTRVIRREIFWPIVHLPGKKPELLYKVANISMRPIEKKCRSGNSHFLKCNWTEFSDDYVLTRLYFLSPFFGNVTRCHWYSLIKGNYSSGAVRDSFFKLVVSFLKVLYIEKTNHKNDTPIFMEGFECQWSLVPIDEAWKTAKNNAWSLGSLSFSF